MTHWFIILYFCSVAPCTARYYANPVVSPYECSRLAIVLRHEWKADGAICSHEVPEGATVLPGRVEEGRWA